MHLKAEKVPKTPVSLLPLKRSNPDGSTLFYLSLVYICGLFILATALRNLPAGLIPSLIIWSLLNIAAELKPLNFTPRLSLTTSIAIHMAVIILFGTPAAVLISTIGNFATDLVNKKGIKKLLFNVSQYAISVYLAGVVFHNFKQSPSAIDLGSDLPAIILSSITFAGLNLFLVCTVIALSEKLNFFKIIEDSFKTELLHFATMIPLALLIVIVYSQEPAALVFLVLPFVLAHFSFDSYIQLRRETRGTFEILADIIDQKDSYTASHSRRVAGYASAIAREMNLPIRQIDEIYDAGRIHDLGKVGVGDQILNKSAALSKDEVALIQKHPAIGYSLLNRLRTYRQGASYIHYHHERIDGKGYPQGLSGSRIPLGARILSVADSFDAMTTDRPYRRALTRREAVQELRKCSGKQFDPEIVEVFIKALEENKICVEDRLKP
ncbi:MAG: HD domain-containing protein [Peptococcaceae bacterium]|jgi:HD-GYP domain-containing protein (c-di-GMP phosphodiesterase class II)|nr:MAG: HD domain-containing protein [Peptococcaceae bacterium]